ncbi:hypothetical protein F0000_24795 [Aquimarina sp. RZ0]|nr:hypothetical protein F0000_24795 [Aquimarina sp. RZ0]
MRNSFLVDIKQPLTLIWKHIYSRFFPLTSLSFEMRNNNKKMPDDYNAKDKNIVSNESEQRLLEKCTFIIPIKGTIMEIEYRSENLGSQRLFYEKILRFIYSYFKDRAFVFKDAETIIYNRYFV